MTDRTPGAEEEPEEVVDLPRAPPGSPPLPPIGEKVERWLKEEGFVVRRYHDEGVRFFLGARSPSGVVLHAFQPKDKDDMVLFGGSADLSEDDAAKLEGLEKARRDRLLWDLRIALLQGGFAFNISPSPAEMRKVLITQALWGEGITKNGSLGAVQHVTNGVFLVIGFLAREFGYPP